MQARLQRRYQNPLTIFHMTAIFRSCRNVIAKKVEDFFSFHGNNDARHKCTFRGQKAALQVQLKWRENIQIKPVF